MSRLNLVISKSSRATSLLPSLLELRLAGCGLTEIPLTPENLTSLVVLDLSTNWLEGSLPKAKDAYLVIQAGEEIFDLQEEQEHRTLVGPGGKPLENASIVPAVVPPSSPDAVIEQPPVSHELDTTVINAAEPTSGDPGSSQVLDALGRHYQHYRGNQVYLHLFHITTARQNAIIIQFASAEIAALLPTIVARCARMKTGRKIRSGMAIAVDAHTSTQLFEECLLGILRHKTIIDVTHQVEFLPAADLLLVMQNGRVAHAGKFEES
ncbi:hypothetical protein IFM89_039008 [Coptis chinensis]|uniref:Uncharacterized protein n=1 Tax=Coptis chinensis TaxID=261450 RepID=A0A835IHF8_9MAGN|nr:hypothetical protein IFM89_039008 [Coptis chinensis]